MMTNTYNINENKRYIVDDFDIYIYADQPICISIIGEFTVFALLDLLFEFMIH